MLVFVGHVVLLLFVRGRCWLLFFVVGVGFCWPFFVVAHCRLLLSLVGWCWLVVGWVERRGGMVCRCGCAVYRYKMKVG